MEAQHLEPDAKTECPDKYEASWAQLRAADGVLVPGGFGGRGVEGKIAAATYARTNKVPYLGICLGMQARSARWQWQSGRARPLGAAPSQQQRARARNWHKHNENAS